jgi:hypothetical protein
MFICSAAAHMYVTYAHTSYKPIPGIYKVSVTTECRRSICEAAVIERYYFLDDVKCTAVGE